MEKQSSSRFRIDEQVFLTMIIISALSLFVLAFRYKSEKSCQPIKILIKDNEALEGSPVAFSAATKEGETYRWDFGDGTVSGKESLPTIVYTYKTAGTYTVAVTVNDKCEAWQKITVREKALTINTALQPVFSVPDSAYVQQKVQFADHTSDATSWEWRFGETEGVDNTTQNPVYIYDKPGPKTVYLKINGRNDRAGTRVIFIKDIPHQKGEEDFRQKNRNAPRFNRLPRLPDAPVTAPNIATETPVVKKAPEISNSGLEALLRQVVTGEKKASDFSEYLCNNLEIPVLYNKKSMHFSDMCNKIREVNKPKKVKSIEISQVRDATTGCITFMGVVLDKKGWLW